MVLNKKSPVPLYLQVKEIFSQKIDSGELRPHDRLPSERELGEELGISRMTVRQALTQLTHDGRIYTIVGKGTYVAPPRIDQDLHQLTGFTEDMRTRGLTTSSRIIEAALLPAPPDLAEALQIRPGAMMVKLEHLRLADGVPLALVADYLPHHLCPDVLEHDMATRSLYAVLRDHYGLKLVRARQTVQAALANQREADLLGLSWPSAILHMDRTTFLDDNQIIVYARTAYRGDRYIFHVMLRGSAGSGELPAAREQTVTAMETC